MKFDLRVKIGFEPAAAPPHPVMDVPSWRVQSQCRLAGSYHVLEMRRHFEEYVEKANSQPQLQPATGVVNFPPTQVYTWLKFKLRAAGVTANIGEAIGALLAREHFGCGHIGDVVHLSTTNDFSRWKSPDYIVRIGQNLPPILSTAVAIAQPGVAPPNWWPMESKARNATSDKRAVEQALVQLAAYWWQAAPVAQGFGLVVNCLHAPLSNQSNRRLDLHIFMPIAGGMLSNDIAARQSSNQSYRDYINDISPDAQSGDISRLTRFLYGSRR